MLCPDVERYWMGKKRVMRRTKRQYPDDELEFNNYESLIWATKRQPKVD